jgi:N12 class adenine-specific DNA methylase
VADFDPDAFLNDTSPSGGGGGGFDPDAFLADKPQPQPDRTYGNAFGVGDVVNAASNEAYEKAKQLGSGLVKGTVGLPGIPGYLTDAAGRAMDWGAGKALSPEQFAEYQRLQQEHGALPPGIRSLPKPEDFIKPFEQNVSGPLPEVRRNPDGTPVASDEYLQELGGFLPFVVGGPGSIATRLLTRAVAPATGAFAAEKAAEGTGYEEVAGFAGMLAGHPIASAAGNLSRNAVEARLAHEQSIRGDKAKAAAQPEAPQPPAQDFSQLLDEQKIAAAQPGEAEVPPFAFGRDKVDPNVRLVSPEVPHFGEADPVHDSVGAARAQSALDEMLPETKKMVGDILRDNFGSLDELEAATENKSRHEFNADLNEDTQRHAAGIAVTPGQPSTEIRQSYRQRRAEEKERIQNINSEYLGPQVNEAGWLRMQKQARKNESAPFWKTFEDTRIAPTEALKEILTRPDMKAATAKANRQLKNMGKPIDEGFEDELGKENRIPTARAFQLAKEALDDKIDAAFRSGNKNNARHLLTLKNALLNEIDNHPDPAVRGVWRDAREKWAPITRVMKAYEFGRDKLLSATLDESEIPHLLERMGEPEKQAAIQGVAKHFNRVLDRARGGELTMLGKALTDANRAKLAALLGEEKANGYFKALEAERRMHNSMNRLVDNSETQARRLYSKHWLPPEEDTLGSLIETGPGIVGTAHGLISHPWRTVAKGALKLAGRELAKRKDGQKALYDRIRGEAARIWTMQGPEGDAALRSLYQDNGTTPPPIPTRGPTGALPQTGNRESLQAALDSGAPLDELEQHPYVQGQVAIDRSRVPTGSPEQFADPDWRDARVYNFNGEKVHGWDDAVQRLTEQAKDFAKGPVENGRHAIIVLGPPASGKSSISEPLARRYKAALVDADEAKKVIPEYENGVGTQAVHEESSELAKDVFFNLGIEGANLILPKVGHNAETIRKSIENLKAAGYTVDIAHVAATPEISGRRNIKRFLDTGRLVDPNYIKEVGDKPRQTAYTLRGEANDFLDADTSERPTRIIEGNGQLADHISAEIADASRNGRDVQPALRGGDSEAGGNGQGQEPSPFAAAQGLIGAEPSNLRPHRVSTADGTAIDVAPVVVEASSLKTSQDAGYDKALQPRQRSRAASQAQVRDIASNLDPERLGYSAEADRGAPIVGPDGMVESGNGRVLALRNVYGEGGAKVQEYREWLARQGVDVSQYRNPVLVRQRITPMSPQERQAFTAGANQASTLAMSATERARGDAKLIDDKTLNLLHNPNDIGANRDFVRRFVQELPQAEQGALMDASGQLSAEGATRLRNAVFAKAYGDVGVIARIAESTDDEIRSISNALATVAPKWARLRADVEAGRVRPDMDATPDLMEAVKRTAKIRGEGTKLDTYLAQSDAFNKIPDTVEGFMRAFYAPELDMRGNRRALGSKRISDALGFYADEARKVTAEPGLDLGLAPVERRDIQKIARDKGWEGYGEEVPDRNGPGNGEGVPAGGDQIRRSGVGEGREGLEAAGGEGDQGKIFRAAGPKVPVKLRPEEPDAGKLISTANKVAGEWQDKLGPDIKVVMGGSLVSRTYARVRPNEPIDMDIRFLTKNPERDYPKVETVTGLKLRKTRPVDDYPSGSSKGFLVEGPFTRDGITFDVEAAVRTPSYVGWARFYPKVLTADELSAFRGDKASLRGNKEEYKALKGRMLKEVMRRVDEAGGPERVEKQGADQLRREVASRDVRGRPLRTEPLPIGNEQAILEAGARRAAESARPGEEQPPLMQAKKRTAAGQEDLFGGPKDVLGEGLRGNAPQVPGGRQPANAGAATPVRRPEQLSLFGGGGSRGEVGEPHAPIPQHPGGPETPTPGKSESVTKPPDGGGRTGEGGTDKPAPPAVIRGRRDAELKIAERSRSNYRITDEDLVGEGGAKQKVRGNIEAIKVLKQIEDENRDATPEEKAKLVKYTGWGAHAQDMFKGDYRKQWEAERGQLKALLTDEEYDSARASTPNAHYTSPDVVRGMWDAMDHLGYEGGMAIEPSAGIGHFIGLIPDKWTPKTAWTAVELDSVTGRIAKKLYGGAEVNVHGFEDLKRPANHYDLAISNVPFGNYPVEEKPYGSHSIHNFFFIKALDKVRPGGIVSFITSSHTMDAPTHANVRRLLANTSDLVGAIRLPGGSKGAFASNAGTQVTTDIIFLRKKVPGEQPFNGVKWTDLKTIQTPEGPTKINEYFSDRPQMMLGEMRLQGTQHRANEPVLIGDPDGMQQKIAEAARNDMPAGAMLVRDTPPPPPIHSNEIGAGIKDGAFFLKDGKLYQRREGQGHEHDIGTIEASRVKKLIGIRDTYNDLMRAQIDGVGDKDALRADLRKKYDNFVDLYGPINKEEKTVTSRLNKAGENVVLVRHPNFKAFRNDPDSWKVSSIENYDSETGKTKLADIFTKDVIRPPMERQINGPSDALAASLNDKGGVDLDHIAQSLGVDSHEAAISALGDTVFQNPDGRAWETASRYLSGNVIKKLEDARSIAANDPSYLRNVAALEKVQPTPLVGPEITAQFGAPWVPEAVYEDFLKEIGGGGIKVVKVPVTGDWRVKASYFDGDARAKYGTKEVGVDEIAESAMNGRPITVRDPPDRDGHRAVNTTKTEEARVKTELLKEAFTGDPEKGIEGWVWQDPERSQLLEGIYNRLHNDLVGENHDGSHLTLPGLNPDFAGRKHRLDVVWRIIQKGNTLMAHAVGSGKTVSMIASGMEQKRLGLINKPAYVVPNHMLEQFSREFIQAYPDAKILVAEKDEMTRDNRKKFLAKVASNDWDGVIFTHDAFGRINMQRDFREKFIRDQMDELERVQKAEEQEGGKNSPTVKAMEKRKKTFRKKLDKLMNEERKDEGTTFEESGIDFMYVDEAHKYKNLDFITRFDRVKGLAQNASQRAEDLFLKTRYLEQNRPGRSAVFATGTPISNTMAEMWTMQRYLQYDKLKERGLETFDAWANTFGKVATNTELSQDGRTFKDVASFSRFVNIPELISLYSEIADTKTAAMLKLPAPEAKTHIVNAKLSSAEENFVQGVIKSLELLKGVRPEKGAPMAASVGTAARKVATDGRLIGNNVSDQYALSNMPNPGTLADFDFNPQGKVAKAVGNIHKIWENGKEPGTVQMVFLDMGTPKNARKGKAKSAEEGGDEEGASDFSVYDDLKQRLVAKGIPSHEIAFIHDATDDIKKAKLFKKVRDGDIRVLMGSTEKMGVGTNVQDRLIAMHHLDAPWKPAEVEQRDGRIIRQGNLNSNVDIYRYVTEKSFDAFMWQTLERKAGFLNQVMSGAKGSRWAEDIDNPLPDAAQMKAAASGDPRILEHAELDRNVRMLTSQKRVYDQTKSRAFGEGNAAKSRIEQYETALPGAKEDAGRVTDTSGKKFAVDLDGKTITERKAAGDEILDRLKTFGGGQKFYTPKVVNVGRMSGFDMNIQLRHVWDGDGTSLEATPSLVGNSRYAAVNQTVINEHTDPAGLIRRFENILGNIKDNPTRLEKELANERKSVERLEKTLTTAWPKEKEYQESLKKLDEFTKAIKAPKHPDVHSAEVKAKQSEPVAPITEPKEMRGARLYKPLGEQAPAAKPSPSAQTSESKPQEATAPKVDDEAWWDNELTSAGRLHYLDKIDRRNIPGKVKWRYLSDSAKDRLREARPEERARGGRVMAHYIDSNPTEAQKEAGNYRKAHINVHGLDIAIENAKGHERSGIGPDDKRWSVTMPAAYGYLKRTTGADQDCVDCYVGPHRASRKVFVIDQLNAETGKYDEHKCMLAFGSAAQAKAVYLKGFSDGKGGKRLGHMVEMSIDDFKDWLANGDTTKPLKDSDHDWPVINHTYDVNVISELSKAGDIFYYDKSLPRRIMNNGKPLDPVQPLLRHEVAEYKAMKEALAAFKTKYGREPSGKERVVIYKTAHKDHGNIAERQWLTEHDYDISQWNAWCRSALASVEKKAAPNAPSNPDVKPIPHERGNLEVTLGA